MEAENWIQDILNSTQGMIKISPDDTLFVKIQSKLNAKNTIATPWIWITAASFVILLSLNIKILFTKSNKEMSQTEIIASGMSNSNQLY